MIPLLGRLRILVPVAAMGLPGVLAASTPGITITATNIAIDDRGTASTQFTVTSSNGFAGKVGVYCQEPNPNLLPFVILPQCSHPTQYVDVPEGGSATGTIAFYPPWTPQQTSSGLGPRRQPLSPIPLFASIIVGLGFLRLRARSAFRGMLAAAVCLTFLSGMVGCTATGGEAMTPGSYTYTINGATVPGESPAATASSHFTVTVRCNQC